MDYIGIASSFGSAIWPDRERTRFQIGRMVADIGWYHRRSRVRLGDGRCDAQPSANRRVPEAPTPVSHPHGRKLDPAPKARPKAALPPSCPYGAVELPVGARHCLVLGVVAAGLKPFLRPG
jgi:hypothetical protein